MLAFFGADIIDVDVDTMVIQATGDADKIEALHSMLLPFGVLEMMRTGEVAMVRGAAGRRGDGVEEAVVYEDIGGV